MVQIILGPDYDLVRRLDKMESALNQTRLNPVIHIAVETSQTDFFLAVGPTVVGQQSAVVPDAYRSCRVFCGASVAAMNSTAAAADLYVACSINGVGGPEMAAETPTGVLGSATAMTTRTLTDLVAGSTITVEALVRTGSGVWVSNSLNVANTSALFMFHI
jgi:hypothetical protein